MKLKERHQIVKGIEQKLCAKCQRWKSLSLFGKNDRHLDRLQDYCIKWDIKRRIKYNQKIKDLYFAHYGGYKCSACGCNVTNKEGLTLDHINNDGAKMGKITGGRFYRWLVAHNFPPDHKLQVLCGTHQLIKENKHRRRDVRKRIKNL